MAQELHEFEQARSYYQQALQIKIEFNDRYSQASTYHQLSRLAEELGELEEVEADYMLDLQTTTEFNEQYDLGASLRNLAQFYQTIQDPALIRAVSQLLSARTEQVQK